MTRTSIFSRILTGLILMLVVLAIVACAPREQEVTLRQPQRLAPAANAPSQPASQPGAAQPAAQPGAATNNSAQPATHAGNTGAPAQAAQAAQAAPASAPAPAAAAKTNAQPPANPPAQGQPQTTGSGNVAYPANVSFTLKTALADGRLAFVGVGGEIDGKVNPALRIKPGETVQITLINGDGVDHDIVLPDLKVASEHVLTKNASTAISFKVDKEGEYVYYCSVPGHRQAGMEGRLIVAKEGAVQEVALGADISREPTDIPKAVPGDRAAQFHRIELETIEIEGQLADGTTYTFWTYNGKVPGPFLRVRAGDTIEVRLKNRAGSLLTHSVDFHSVTGPGGGAAVTQAAPGQDLGFTWKAINPGLYVYHCATPMVAHHITNGMYGLILVEPKGGLPPVDREYYIMQGEIYTHGPLKQRGRQQFDVEKLLAEQPEYFIFNGSVDALTKKYPMKAKVGETVRMFVGVGGPNFTSSFHVIGEIFDRVYDMGSLETPPLRDVQTVTIPAGGSAMVEFKLDVPGRYILVDHALSRLERGLVGFLMAEGPDAPDIFKPDPNNPKAGAGGH